MLLIGVWLRPAPGVRATPATGDPAELRQQIALLESELARRDGADQVASYDSFRGFSRVPATVVRTPFLEIDPRALTVSVEIDDERVVPGCAVIGPRGLVGVVDRVRFGRAVVRRVDDPGTRVVVAFDGRRGVVAGTGDPGVLSLEVADTVEPLDSGLLLVTGRSASAAIPGGIVVGTITGARTNFEECVIEAAETAPFPETLTCLVPRAFDDAPETDRGAPIGRADRTSARATTGIQR